MKAKTIITTIFIFALSLNLFIINNTTNATSFNFNKITNPSNILAKTTLPDNIATKFLENDINMYDPTGGCITNTNSSSSLSGTCGGDVTGSSPDERLRQVIEGYASLAMNLQITYGIPWELLFAQFYTESGVGLAGTAAAQARDGKFNWLGMKHSGSHHYGSSSYTNYPYPLSEGVGHYESYDSIEDMMKAYASGDILRNGAYDDAFQYTNKDNYDLASFARTMGSTYCCSGYGDSIMNETLPKVRAIAKELGLPTSEELQKQENIPIGGKFPIGTSPSEVYDDSVTCVGGSASIADGGKNVVIIGDSISVLSDAALKQKFPNAEYHTQSSKFFATDDPVGGEAGLTILNKLDLSGKDIVIFALGTNNDGVDEAKIQQVLDKTGKDRTVVFVTNYSMRGDYYNSNNAAFKAAANKNPNVFVADWAAAVSKDPGKYIADGHVHPNEAGQTLWAETIANAITGIGDGNPSSDSSSSSSSTPSSSSNNAGQKAIEAAHSQIGKPYSYGCPYSGCGSETDPPGFDCNGLAWWSWRQAGVDIPAPSGTSRSTSRDGQWQAAQNSGHLKKNQNELSVGDVVFFFRDPNNDDSTYHVGLYAGNGKIIHSPQPGETVTEAPIDVYGGWCEPGGICAGWSPINSVGSDSGSSSTSSASNAADPCATALSGNSSGGGGCYDESNFPSYIQGDPEWSGMNFHGYNFGAAGCGPTSLAEIITSLTGQRVTPADIVNNGYGDSVNNSISILDPEMAAKYDLETEVFTIDSVSEGIQTMKKYLQDGWMIHTGGNANRSTGVCVNSISTGCGGHYVSLLKIDSNGQVTHTDVNGTENVYGNEKHTLEELFEMGLYTDGHPSVAFRKKGSSGSSSNCGSDGQPISESGLTLEEAAQLAKNYGANKNNSSKNAAGEGQWFINCNGNSNGNGGSNCVTFSAFFANKFGKQEDYSSWQDGINTVNDLATLGVKTGSTPKVWSVFSGGEAGSFGHTGVIVGYYDSKWIVIQASCSNPGSGAGTGLGEFSSSGTASTGAAWASAVPDLTVNQYGPTIGNGSINTSYAYLDVDTQAISEYLKNGE